MTPPSDEERIRKGLKFLEEGDRAVIKAAVLLEVLEGEQHPQGPETLIKEYTFQVEGKTFCGHMTKEQDDYLQGDTSTLKKFADAIAHLILKQTSSVVGALQQLAVGVHPPSARTARPGTGISVPATGCCSYDTNQQADGVTQSACEGGLAGNWSPLPCQKQPPDK